MKKSSFVAMLMGTVSVVLFALGMCMALIPEWGAFRPGIVSGCVGLLLGLTTVIVWRMMEHKGAYPFFGQKRFCRCSRCGWRIGIGNWYVFLHGLGQNGARHRHWIDRHCRFALLDSVDKRFASMNVSYCRENRENKSWKTTHSRAAVQSDIFRFYRSAHQHFVRFLSWYVGLDESVPLVRCNGGVLCRFRCDALFCCSMRMEGKICVILKMQSILWSSCVAVC